MTSLTRSVIIYRELSYPYPVHYSHDTTLSHLKLAATTSPDVRHILWIPSHADVPDRLLIQRTLTSCGLAGLVASR